MAGAVSRLVGRPVAVVGDVMLDHFLIGRVDRISPEAPVPVVRFERDEYRLGGAANVALNVATLGGGPLLVGVRGDDQAAVRLEQELTGHRLDPSRLITAPGRRTTRKVRIVTTRNQQVARVDYEADDGLPADTLTGLVEATRRAVHESEAVILSDYRKGVVNPAVMSAAIDAATARKIPVLVDPKIPQPERYRGVTVITPNHHEAELMAQMTIRTADDVGAAARLLYERTGASVIVTWGEHGMWVCDRSAGAATDEHLPASAREVADVTGAGDTVIAVLGLGLAAGLSLIEAAGLANAAAGLVVARFGPAAVTREELRAHLGS